MAATQASWPFTELQDRHFEGVRTRSKQEAILAIEAIKKASLFEG
jgi:hypothetical protein